VEKGFKNSEVWIQIMSRDWVLLRRKPNVRWKLPKTKNHCEATFKSGTKKH